MPTESEDTRRLCRELEALGAIALPYVGHQMQRPGWPDRWLCSPLWTGWLELKSRDGELAPLQRKRLREVWTRDPGGAACYWHGSQALKAADQHWTEWPLLARESASEAERLLLALQAMRNGAVR